MEQKKVFEILSDEREYQDTIRKENEGDQREDKEKSIADFILYMEHQLNIAKAGVYNLDEEGTKNALRKMTGLGVTCAEAFGMPTRKWYKRPLKKS